jgi:acyl carrier protein
VDHRQIELALRVLVAEVAKKDLGPVGLDDNLVRVLGLDSLLALRLLAAVEKRFNVRFPDDKLGDFHTLRSLLTFITQAAQESAA